MSLRNLLLAFVFCSALALHPPLSSVVHAQGTAESKAAGAATVPSEPATTQATTGTATRPAASSMPASQPKRASDQRRKRAPGPSEPPGKTMDACKAQFMRGAYASAAAGYKDLMSKDNLKVAAATAAAQALAAQGDYAQAMATLSKAGEAAAGDIQWHLQFADVLATVGQYEKALEHATTANKLNPLNAPAIFARGQLLETLGRKDQAKEVYRTMDMVVAGDAYKSDAAALVALGKIMDRDCVLNGKKYSEQAQNILQNYFQEAYMTADKGYWPANVAAGLFGLAKHRTDIMAAEFKLAEQKNKRIVEVAVGKGFAMLEDWAFEPCMEQVNVALGINPNSTDALTLKAVCLMQWRKVDEVPAVLDEVLKINPNNLDALSLYAAVHVRKDRKDKAQACMDKVLKVNKGYGRMYDIIGQWLAAGRQFDEAEVYYAKAIAMSPEQADPLTNLGLAYMQMGQEEKAVEILTKANAIDDFRPDVVNYLNLLRRLATEFQVRESEHFIVKANKELDSILIDQVIAYCEKMHDEICGDFRFTAEDQKKMGKAIVEFFPTHQQFSVRITGKGWIGTVGASTGRVIAMVAPSPDTERTAFGPYNWAAVLRHEYTHTITLAKTENRIPHWFTEACAVWEQPDRRNYQATQLLVLAVKNRVAQLQNKPVPRGTSTLFPIHELDWGFIRPKLGADRSLAYAQSEWVMEYLIHTRGFDVIIKMLEGFRDRMTQEEVFEKIIGMNQADFDKAFLEWAKTQVQEWGFEYDPVPDLESSQKLADAKPKDAQARATLAVAQYYARKSKAAVKTAREALELDADNKDALGILALVLSSQKDKTDEALEFATRLLNVDHKSRIAPKVIADVCMEKRRWAQAIEALELLKLRAPMDPYSYTQLAKCYLSLGQPERAIPNLIELHEHTMTDPVYARQIAELYRTLNDDNQALLYYQKVLQINPYDVGTYKAIAFIHYAARQWDEAIQAARNMVTLQPDSAESWATLAKLEFYGGRDKRSVSLLRQARIDAAKSLSIESDDEVQELLVKIDEQLKTLPATQSVSRPATASGRTTE